MAAHLPTGLALSNLLYLAAYYSVDVTTGKCTLTGLDGTPQGIASCIFTPNITVRGQPGQPGSMTGDTAKGAGVHPTCGVRRALGCTARAACCKGG